MYLITTDEWLPYYRVCHSFPSLARRLSVKRITSTIVHSSSLLSVYPIAPTTPSCPCGWLQELAVPGELDGTEWPAVYKSKYPGSWWYYLKLCFRRQLMLLLRDTAYMKSQIFSALIMGEPLRIVVFMVCYKMRCCCPPPPPPVLVSSC